VSHDRRDVSQDVKLEAIIATSKKTVSKRRRKKRGTRLADNNLRPQQQRTDWGERTRTAGWWL